ncbi:MAG: HDOD domain-containing protein [Marinobacter sp.]|nr:HDOD domain-containing protein [Marinobacter sp.]
MTVSQIPDVSQLPSLPQVVVSALEACRRDAGYREISRLLASDTALTARVLALASSPLLGAAGDVSSMEQALLRLGTRRIQALILTAGLRQLLNDLSDDQWQQLRDFWRHALTTALTAKTLATLTRYPAEDEAFTLGMLHNIGELLALNAHHDSQVLLDQQAEIAAALVAHWGLGPMAADAMRYQQLPPDRLQDASHLVKIINLSVRLALTDRRGIDAAYTLFGLSEALTLELIERINHDVATLAESLGVPLDATYPADAARQHLLEATLSNALVMGASQPLQDVVPTPAALIKEAALCLMQLTARPVLAFHCQQNELTLFAHTAGPCPHLDLPLSPALSLLTMACKEKAIQQLDTRLITVLDQQLLGLLQMASMTAVPLIVGDQLQGALVVGTLADEQPFQLRLIQLFAANLEHQLAQLTALRHSHTAGSDSELSAQLEYQRIRQIVHEVSNPLTIVRQYVHQLHSQLTVKADEPQLHQDLMVIREELERATELLLRLTDEPPASDNSPAGLDLNREVQLLTGLFEHTLLNAVTGLSCRLKLSDTPTLASIPQAGFRQVYINLLRNAIEAMPEGGQIIVSTTAGIWQQGRNWIELIVEDNGPGIPPEMQAQLFSPVQSSKGSGHSGLGLSIVKQLMDDMEGIIGCRTDQTGTSFRLLLPTIQNRPT